MMEIIAIILIAISALTVGFIWACAIASVDYDEIDEEKEREENDI